jgi:hypothetical protein
VLVRSWVVSLNEVLPGLSRSHRGRVDSDFAASLAHATGIPNADMHGLRDRTCCEA